MADMLHTLQTHTHTQSQYIYIKTTTTTTLLSLYARSHLIITGQAIIPKEICYT